MPLKNSHVIHPRWEQHHRPVSADALPAECVINRYTSERAWNDVAGRSEYGPGMKVYPETGLGVCRLTRGGTGSMPAGTVVVAGRATTLSDYTLVIPTCSDLVQVNDIATVLRCDGDPDLVGKRLRIKNVLRGSYTWERLLSCELEPPTTR